MTETCWSKYVRRTLLQSLAGAAVLASSLPVFRHTKQAAALGCEMHMEAYRKRMM
jgi:hypothetical protein